MDMSLGRHGMTGPSAYQIQNRATQAAIHDPNQVAAMGAQFKNADPATRAQMLQNPQMRAAMQNAGFVSADDINNLQGGSEQQSSSGQDIRPGAPPSPGGLPSGSGTSDASMDPTNATGGYGSPPALLGAVSDAARSAGGAIGPSGTMPWMTGATQNQMPGYYAQALRSMFGGMQNQMSSPTGPSSWMMPPAAPPATPPSNWTPTPAYSPGQTYSSY